jgi:hypothetical protein
VLTAAQVVSQAIVGWAVDLTRASLVPGMLGSEIAERFESVHATLRKALPGVEDAARS